MPDFLAASTFSEEESFNQVKFGMGAKALDTELNEMQEILLNKISAIGKVLIADGFTEKPALTYEGGILTVPAATIIAGGIVYSIEEPMTIEASVGDTIYLAVTFSEVNGSTSILKSGNLSGGTEIINDIYDSRVGGLETARRIQAQVQLVKNMDNLEAIYLPVCTIGALEVTDNTVQSHVALTDNAHQTVTEEQISFWDNKTDSDDFSAHINNAEIHSKEWETKPGAQFKADTAETNAKSYTNTKIADLINSSPATLDTLKELAVALGNDPNFATTVTNLIAQKMPLAGARFTGMAYAQINENYSTAQLCNFIISTLDADPALMNKRDVWIKVKLKEA
jgi:hypothetical protein